MKKIKQNFQIPGVTNFRSISEKKNPRKFPPFTTSISLFS